MTACLICGLPTPNGFQLSGHGWFCSPKCYGIFIEERQKRIAKELYGNNAIVGDTK
jgi:predicted nucleic acid-binding Zn ribbon protein